MPRSLPSALLAAAVAIAMVVLGLWCWGNAQQIAGYYETSRPDVTAMAVRAGAVATIATAQLVLALFITPRLRRRGQVDRLLVVAAGFVGLTALACTIVFTTAGR